MGLSAEKKKIVQEIKAGVHLVTIMSIKRLLDAGKNQVILDGEIGIVVQFATGDNKKHEQTYWVGKGKDGRERHFTSLGIDAGVDMAKTPMPVTEFKGKLVWIAVREVYTLVNGGADVLKSDITGEDIIEHFVFKTAPVYDPDRPPTFPGDPARNGGQAMDEFISYKNMGESAFDNIVNSAAELPVAQLQPEVKTESVSGLNSAGIAITPKNEAAYDQLLDEGKTHEEAIEIIKSFSVVEEIVTENIDPLPAEQLAILANEKGDSKTTVEYLTKEEIVSKYPETLPNFGESKISAAEEFIKKKREELAGTVAKSEPVFDPPTPEAFMKAEEVFIPKPDNTPVPEMKTENLPNFLDESPDTKF